MSEDTDHLSGVIEGADVAARQSTRKVIAQKARQVADAISHGFSAEIELAKTNSVEIAEYLEREAE